MTFTFIKISFETGQLNVLLVSFGTVPERAMNVDQILQYLNAEQADYILIGGMNFLIRHQPELTFDVDVWIWDQPENLRRLNLALKRMGAAWGPTEQSWAPVPENWEWLQRQTVFCLTTELGALDIFREVKGLEGRYSECKEAADHITTATGIPFASLSDEHMLACQEALPPSERKQRRMEILREAIQQKKGGPSI
jgi:hypothetical protein